MTREEAIERLSICGEVCDDCLTCKAHDEAIEIAIAALEAQKGYGHCKGCKWLAVRHQKCSCCRRNLWMKDNYEEDDDG